MNYKKIYENLMSRAKNRSILQGYTEKHHIVPVCIGGDNDKENIVKLTPEEHYLAHQLEGYTRALAPVYENGKLVRDMTFAQVRANAALPVQKKEPAIA